jgi:UPF0716 family protein affecting phage T7 exclusion
VKPPRKWTTAFTVAFVVLLLDGVAAIWLGQVTGRGSLLVLGLVLMAAALGVGALYQRWRRALVEIEAARDDLQREIGALRRAVEDARAGGARGP